jgi:hypothetical protein
VKRNPTNPDGVVPAWRLSEQQKTLSEQQKTAVDFLIIGHTLQATADAIGVARPTVSHWLHHHPGFIAAVNSRRAELWEELSNTIRALASKALAVLARELDGDDALGVAIQVLRLAGVTGQSGAPIGPTTAEEVLESQRVRELERQRMLEELCQ